MTKLGGYAGRILNVDLSSGEISDEVLSEELLRRFIGGYGLGARLLYERIPAEADPLGPENILGLVTGPLTGTRALIGSRYCAVGKSPLTGGWGDASSGGAFGQTLKRAGYDAVFAKGLSEKPVYLLVDGGEAELQSAEELWGLSTAETEGALKARHGSDVRVASIGQGGERQALIAGIITDLGRAAARSGLGAVMGAKRLKAVVVRGDVRPNAADPERVTAMRQEYLPKFREEGTDAEIMRVYGTPGYTRALLEIGRTPIKNWKGSYPDGFAEAEAEAIDGPAVVAYETEKYACLGCPLACGGIVRWDYGGQEFVGHKPEYESLAALGSYCRISDLEAVMMLEEMCNWSGLDTISAGAAIAFAMECYEHDLLGEEQLDGLTLEWGDGDSAIALLERMIERRGLGDALADGVVRAAERIGKGSSAFAIHAGGQELPAHDPRHTAGFGLLYEISPTPGRHTQGGAAAADLPPEKKALFGLEADDDTPTAFARAYAALSAHTNVLSAAGLCTSGSMCMGPEHVPDFIAAVTGWDFDMAECLEVGERIQVVRHLFGLREGYNPLEARVAPRAMGHPPLETGPTAGVTIDMQAERAAYLEHMDWDPVTGMPSATRLASLGLSELVARSHTGV